MPPHGATPVPVAGRGKDAEMGAFADVADCPAGKFASPAEKSPRAGVRVVQNIVYDIMRPASTTTTQLAIEIAPAARAAAGGCGQESHPASCR